MSSTNEQQAPSRSARWNLVSMAMIVVGMGALVAAAAVWLVIGTGDDKLYSGPETATAFGNVFAEDIAQPSPTPGANPPSSSAIQRITIPKFEVDAPVIVLGLDEDNVMESPDEPCDAGWYDFTSRPGFGGNAVFSGHVDWFNLGSSGCKCQETGGCGGAGPAVFWNLKDLEQGDLIEIALQDGTIYQYQVTARTQVDPNTADIGKIVGRTEREVITLITCGGQFDFEARHYTERVVVRAERVLDEPGVAVPSASTAP